MNFPSIKDKSDFPTAIEHPYNFSKKFFILINKVFSVIMQESEFDLANIGKKIFEYNFSASMSLSLQDLTFFIWVNIYCFVCSNKDKLSPSSFDDIFNNTANFFNSS